MAYGSNLFSVKVYLQYEIEFPSRRKIVRSVTLASNFDRRHRSTLGLYVTGIARSGTGQCHAHWNSADV